MDDRFTTFYTYKEYLKAEKDGDRQSFRYWRWRREVLKRDGYKCVKCQSTNNLNVHHLKLYKDNIFLRTKKNNGVTLCKSCHALMHSWMHKERPVYILRKATKLPAADSAMCADKSIPALRSSSAGA